MALAWGAAGLVRADPDPDPTIGKGALTVDGATPVSPSHWDVHQSITYDMHIDGITEYNDDDVLSAFVKGKDNGGPFVDEIPNLTVSSGSIDFYYTIRDTSCETAVVAYGRQGLLSNAGAIDPAHSGSAAHLRTVDAVGDVIDCAAVGGVVDIPADSSHSLVGSADEGPPRSSVPYHIVVAVAAVAAALALAAGGWYARRRLS